MPSVEEEGGEVAGAAEGYEVEVKIERLDGTRIVELEVKESIDGGGVVEATEIGGGLEEGQ